MFNEYEKDHASDSNYLCSGDGRAMMRQLRHGLQLSPHTAHE